MKDIPENVLWLLEFTNLGCKAGQIRQWDVSNQNPPVKRPPVEPPSDLDTKNPERVIISLGGITVSLARNKDAWTECSCGKRDGLIDYPCAKGYEDNKLPCIGHPEVIDLCWKRDKKTEKLKYLGQGEGNPTFKEFTDFFFNPKNKYILKFNTEPTKCPVRVFVESCRGILPAPPIPAMFCRDNVHKYFIKLWENVRSVITFVIRDNEDCISVKEMYEISKSDAKLQNHPIPKTIYNALFDFLLISSGGLFQVKQCACCGRLHTGKSKYCHTECRIRLNYSTTKNNRKSVTNARKRSKPIQQKKDCDKIYDVYRKNGYSQERARQKAKEWVYRDQKTYKQFLRKERSSWGEGLL